MIVAQKGFVDELDSGCTLGSRQLQSVSEMFSNSASRSLRPQTNVVSML